MITCAKIRKIINNSAGDCSISLKSRTDFDHVTLYVPRTLKVNSKVQGHSLTQRTDIKKRYYSGTDKLSKVTKLSSAIVTVALGL